MKYPNSVSGVMIALLACAGPGDALALATDSDQPIEIEADFAELDEQENKTVYSGNVIVTQGSIRMAGDRLRVNLDDNNELQDVFLEGKPAEFKQRPDDSVDDIIGRALTIEYHAKEDQLFLIESAKVTRGQESFEGYRIDYDTERSIITARAAAPSSGQGAADTTAPAGGRVRIVIPPRKKAEP